MKTQLGTFAGYTAYWEYSDGYNDDGLTVAPPSGLAGGQGITKEK